MSLWRSCSISSRLYFVKVSRFSSTKSKPAKTNASKASFPVSVVNSTQDAEKEIQPLRLAVDIQGSVVKKLKESGASPEELSRAVVELKNRKHNLDQKFQELCPPVQRVDKAKLDNLVKQRFFYDQSFSIYGGAQGLYDFGPAGCSMKNNLLRDWSQFFVLTDAMLEIDCPVLTPESVLKASGHVDRFTDYLVTDSLTGESYRADHLIRQSLQNSVLKERSDETRHALAELYSLDGRGLQDLIDRFSIRAPTTGNPLTEPRQFNLMFETASGTDRKLKHHRHYLRPETAQGIFTNFHRLLEFNRGRLPMAVAQIGQSYRNEIQARSGLLRLREFCLAEIEHFYDPEDSRHPDFASVANLSLPLLSAVDQSDSATAPSASWRQLGAAVNSGLIAHETLGYYLGRVYQFLTRRCGIDPRRLRFRQHPPGEMAHYAADCWDAECLLSSGGSAGGTDFAWVECVGCADRSAYDLSRHSEASGERLVAARHHATDEAATSQHSFTPSVVEPSFGIGRLITAVLEHNFRLRPGGDERRTYLSLPAWLAPYHCALLVMDSGSVDMKRLVRRLSRRLAREGLANWLDFEAKSVSIGKRYARADQLGVPFAVTVDFDSVTEYKAASAIGSFDVVNGDTQDWPAECRQPTVTLRERDSMLQVRVEIDKVPNLVKDLIEERITWTQVMDSQTMFHGQTESRVKR